MKSFLFEIKVDDSRSLILPKLDEAENIFNLIDRDREHLKVWLPWVVGTRGPNDTLNNLVERIKGFESKTQASFYGTYNGDIVASVGFISLKEGVGEIGYWLLSKYQGQGHITAFVKACIEYGFNELGLRRIAIRCAKKNKKSAAVPQRLGFTEESSQKRNKKMFHTLVYTLNNPN